MGRSSESTLFEEELVEGSPFADPAAEAAADEEASPFESVGEVVVPDAPAAEAPAAEPPAAEAPAAGGPETP